jgi:hypothetical protein
MVLVHHSWSCDTEAADFWLCGDVTVEFLVESVYAGQQLSSDAAWYVTWTLV